MKTNVGNRVEPEPCVEFVDLGSWNGGMLAAEYDAEDDAIRVNVRAVDLIRRAFGDAEAHRFTACAVAHERVHRANPCANEAAARAVAAMETETELGRYETILARRERA
jgi:hypothetical protein